MVLRNSKKGIGVLIGLLALVTVAGCQTVKPTAATAPAAMSPSGLEDVFFDFDRSVMRPDARRALDENVRWLKNSPTARITVEGHCDERGPSAYNLALGERRAQSVKSYMTAAGIDASRIKTVSRGEDRPFCREHEERCWKQNRRGHFVVTK